MARYKYFGEKIEPSCEYCKYGRFSADKRIILCEYKGVLTEADKCRKFMYDPIKRVPKRIRPLPKFEIEDFQL